jgi:hypothetical protein
MAERYMFAGNWQVVANEPYNKLKINILIKNGKWKYRRRRGISIFTFAHW